MGCQLLFLPWTMHQIGFIQTLPPSNGHAITLHVALADPHRPDGKSLDLMMELHPLASYAIAGQAAPE